MKARARPGRISAIAFAIGLVLSACDAAPTPSPTTAPPTQAAVGQTPAPPGSATPRAGGTIYLLTDRSQLYYLDPQRIYPYEEVAFLGATLHRSLVSFASSPDPVQGTTLVPDLATDIGRPTDGGRTWSFTLREGVTFQTGDPITCEDVKYGVSRSFATNVLTDGMRFAIRYLDIPVNPVTNPDFPSAYHGPYDGTGQDLFDKAVECSSDQRTITFHLNAPRADFNYATTIGFSPVPRAADSGATYGTRASLPVSSGPYMVGQYPDAENDHLVLVRNPSWNRESDPIRMAYPDSWEIEFGIDAEDIDRRLIAAAGNDAFAIPFAYQDERLQPENVPTVFADPITPHPAFALRAVSDLDQYVRYDWINVQRVTNVKIRQAMMVALDRAALREILGDAFTDFYADGVLKPTIGADYAPTGIWDTFFGQRVPDGGDPDLARRLIQESGETVPTLTFAAPDTPTHREVAKVVIESLGRAGITVEHKSPCGAETYCSESTFYHLYDFGTGGWGPDWPNASTVIPRLFTKAGDENWSQVDDAAFDAAVDDALTTLDRAEQARKWQALNRQAVENAWVIPTLFSRAQRLAGTKVGPIYLWPAYSSLPYAELFVTP